MDNVLASSSIPYAGSLRPLCAFATKAVRERSDIVITFMTCGSFEKRIEAECNRYISDEETTLKARIRYVLLALDLVL